MAVFTRNVETWISQEPKNSKKTLKRYLADLSRDINIYIFHSVYPDKLGDEISKIKISKWCAMTGYFDSVQVYTN